MSTQYIQVTIEFEELDNGQWTANCVELGTATFGDSLGEACDSVREAILIHLNTLEDVGERERFFKENNVVLRKRLPKSVRITAPTDKRKFFRDYYPLQMAGAC